MGLSSTADLAEDSWTSNMGFNPDIFSQRSGLAQRLTSDNGQQ